MDVQAEANDLEQDPISLIEQLHCSWWWSKPMCSLLLDVVSWLTVIRLDLSVVGLSSTCCSVARILRKCKSLIYCTKSINSLVTHHRQVEIDKMSHLSLVTAAGDENSKQVRNCFIIIDFENFPSLGLSSTQDLTEMPEQKSEQAWEGTRVNNGAAGSVQAQ
jgi:hypothetical protein